MRLLQWSSTSVFTIYLFLMSLIDNTKLWLTIYIVSMKLSAFTSIYYYFCKYYLHASLYTYTPICWDLSKKYYSIVRYNKSLCCHSALPRLQLYLRERDIINLSDNRLSTFWTLLWQCKTQVSAIFHSILLKSIHSQCAYFIIYFLKIIPWLSSHMT